MASSRRKASASKEKASEILPRFMLDQLPVLSGTENEVISNLGQQSVSSNPYPSIAKPRKSLSSLYSQSERDSEYEREHETRSLSNHLPTPTPLFQSNSHASSPSVGSGRSTPTSIRRLDPSASPISNDSSSHHTHPSIGSFTGNMQGPIDPSSSSPGGDSSYWRSGRYNSTATSRTAQKIAPQPSKASLDKPLPSEPKSSGAETGNMKVTPNLKSSGFSNNELVVPLQAPSTPQLTHTPSISALSPSSHVAPRSRNTSGQHVIYPNPMLSVFWKASDPSEWTLDRVIYWLEYNKFGPDWIDTFRSRNLHGEEFLSLVNYQKLKNLGHLSTVNEIYDTRPSRFIHILRKVLDKSSSSASNNALGSEQTDESADHRSDNIKNSVYKDDDHASASSNVLRPMRSEYTLGNLYSTDAFTRTAVNNPVHLPVRNKSLEDLHELHSSRARMPTFQSKSKETLHPISTIDTNSKSQV